MTANVTATRRSLRNPSSAGMPPDSTQTALIVGYAGPLVASTAVGVACTGSNLQRPDPDGADCRCGRRPDDSRDAPLASSLALLFRRRFQYCLRSLLLLTVAVAIPCSWLAVDNAGGERKQQRRSGGARLTRLWELRA